MHETGPPGPSSQPPQGGTTLPPVRLPEQGEEVGVEALVAASQAAITLRLEEGLRAINQSAAKLMRQVAAEVWRAAGPDARKNLQTGVIGGLARDDAIRGVFTHMDERYQALHVEIARMEEALRRLAAVTGPGRRTAEPGFRNPQGTARSGESNRAPSPRRSHPPGLRPPGAAISGTGRGQWGGGGAHLPLAPSTHRANGPGPQGTSGTD